MDMNNRPPPLRIETGEFCTRPRFSKPTGTQFQSWFRKRSALCSSVAENYSDKQEPSTKRNHSKTRCTHCVPTRVLGHTPKRRDFPQEKWASRMRLAIFFALLSKFCRVIVASCECSARPQPASPPGVSQSHQSRCNAHWCPCLCKSSFRRHYRSLRPYLQRCAPSSRPMFEIQACCPPI